MFRIAKTKVFKWFVLLTLIFAGTIGYARTVQASPLNQNNGVAQAVVIYRSSCGDACQTLFNNTLQPLSVKYGSSLEMVVIDADLPVNTPAVDRIILHYGISRDSTDVPILLTEADILVGFEQIQAQAESIISKSLQVGGNRSPLLVVSNGNSTSDSLVTELNNTKVELDKVKSELQSSQDQVNNLRLILVFAGGLAFIFILISMVLFINSLRISKTNKSLQNKVNKTLQMLSENEAKFIGTLIGQGSAGVDFLAEMAKVQVEYQKRKTISENAAFLARDFLAMVEKYMGIVPLAQLGARVSYNPKIHRSYQNPKPGDMVLIVEPGWKRKDQILKYAVVQPE